MEAVKQIYLLLICQGFYLGSVCQRWTFPSRMIALIGSCVEIPCTYTPANSSGRSDTVWYLYSLSSYPKILNTKDSSSVIEDYKDRTSLVPGENSCTLRIDRVRRGDDGDKYYPGIAEDRNINVYKKHNRTIYLSVTDEVNIQLYVSRTVTDGEATTIRCSVDHTCSSSPPSLQWNKPGQAKKKSIKLSRGSWREESELTYIPSYEDYGSSVQCTATYPNGQSISEFKPLNINYSPKYVTVTIIGMDEVIEGSDVRLQCISFSKPDVHKYEWYKGKTRLPDRGREITVYNVPRDMEPYSCTAINRVGRGESAPIEISVLYKESSNSKIILAAVIGTICLLLLVSLAYICWRKRGQKLTSNETETTPHATYTDLVRKDAGIDYEQLKPVNATHIFPISEGHVGADNNYENVYH